ncbi:uncharacterized protein [Pyrus communis]|uniref:uncharacterized protein n=1 Tax=Pyrus communis TaxID=23211 RepID=UPI0035C058A7
MSSSRRLYEIDEQQKKLLAEQEELFNLKDGRDEAFVMEEDEDDEHRKQRTSHSRCVMQIVGQISKLRCASNLHRNRERQGLLPEQNIIATLQMLTYGVSADQVDKIARIRKSNILESLMRFCFAVEALYSNEYLRKPTTMDMQKLLKKGEMRDFPGMIGSIDCMRWTWKNCPSVSQEAYGDRK